VDVVWIGVRMWTPLRGHFQQFTDVVCDAPQPEPAAIVEWQRWASDYLGAVAAQDGWQPGRYHFSAERRDDGGHSTEVLAQGMWEWPG
jgi:hypothetical protein